MNLKNKRAIAAAMVATIVASICVGGCKGRKMSNMEPTGDTVEVVIVNSEATDGDTGFVSPDLTSDSIR